jgi:hypothetical protein
MKKEEQPCLPLAQSELKASAKPFVPSSSQAPKPKSCLDVRATAALFAERDKLPTPTRLGNIRFVLNQYKQKNKDKVFFSF